MDGLTRLQYGALVIVSNVAAFLSILGSLTICWSAWAKRNKVYHRLLLALSISDLFASTSMALQPWMSPQGHSPRLYWAAGNDRTCSVVGFWFVTAVLLVSFYSCFLSANFLFTVRYRWSEAKIRQRLEIPAHIAALLVSSFVGVSGLISNAFEPTTFINVCWIGNCSIAYLDEHGVCPPEQINFGWVLGWLVVVCLLVNTGVAVTCTVLIFRTIKAQYQASQRYSFRGTINEQATRREKEVAYQTIAYSFAYFNTFFWIFLGGVFLTFDSWLFRNEGTNPILYITQLLMWTFQPLQGLVNFCVYTRPTYMQWRRCFPERSRGWAMWNAATTLQPPSAATSASKRSISRLQRSENVTTATSFRGSWRAPGSKRGLPQAEETAPSKPGNEQGELGKEAGVEQRLERDEEKGEEKDEKFQGNPDD